MIRRYFARRKMRWAVRRVNSLKIRTREIGVQVVLTRRQRHLWIHHPEEWKAYRDASP